MPESNRVNEGPGRSRLNDLPSLSFRVVWAATAKELEAHLGAWRRLAETALEPNVFFEPEMLLPAMAELAQGAVRVALILSRPRQNPAGGDVLSGLFPVRFKRGRAEIWQHRYAFQGTPLVRGEVAEEVWRFFLGEVLGGERAKANLLRCATMRGDGPMARAFAEVARVQGRPVWDQDVHFRAAFRPAASAEAFAAASIGRKVRRNLKRERKLLEKQGAVESVIGYVGPDEVDGWCDRFLALEASGWKGRAGTAMGSNQGDADWFRAVARGLAVGGRLVGAALRLNGTPVAMGVMLVATSPGEAREAAFFKIAHDEAIQGVSLGALLQWDWLEPLHGALGLANVDSCAIPGHPMIERIWQDRRMVSTRWIASGSRWSRVKLWLFQGAYGLKASRRKPAES